MPVLEGLRLIANRISCSQSAESMLSHRAAFALLVLVLGQLRRRDSNDHTEEWCECAYGQALVSGPG